LTFGQSIWTNAITDANPSASNPYINDDVKNANITVSGIRRSAAVNAPTTATANLFKARGWRGVFDATRYFEFSLSAHPVIELISLIFHSIQLQMGLVQQLVLN
jgi:hypothetical protein